MSHKLTSKAIEVLAAARERKGDSPVIHQEVLLAAAEAVCHELAALRESVDKVAEHVDPMLRD